MLQHLRRFPLVGILVLATALAACGEDDPSDPGDDDDDDDGTATVTFTYEPGPNAPEITSVAVPGEFTTNPGIWSPTDPNFQMEEQSDGSWELTVELEPGTYEYKYHFNGTTWASDMCNDMIFGDASGHVSPQAEECNASDNGNAIITVVDDND